MGRATFIKRFGGEPGDWICARHWGRLTRAERRLWARFKRLARRYGWEALGARADRIWSALVRRSNDIR